MKVLNKVSVVALTIITTLGLAGSITQSFAATTPDLGAATSYGILSDTYTNTNVPLPTTVNGDVGFTTGPVVVPLGIHANYGVAAPYPQAGIDQGVALAALNAGANLACDVTFPIGAVDLSNNLFHPSTTYSPGVYCIDGAMSIDTAPGITLSGNGTYIFRSTGAFTTSAGITVTLAGASACNVFWNPDGATTIGANNFFKGTVIPTLAAAHDITVLSTTSWIGRALTFGHTVTTPDANVVITVPTCTLPNLTVTKTIVNTGGGTKVVANFPLFVNGVPVVSGVVNSFAAGAYAVTETTDPNYTQSFSDNCDINGNISLLLGDNKTCTITNTYVPPVSSGGGGGGGSLRIDDCPSGDFSYSYYD